MNRLTLPDETVWPDPESAGEVEHDLRYGDVLAARFEAASVVSAYRTLCTMPAKTAEKKLRWIRAHLKSAAAARRAP